MKRVVWDFKKNDDNNNNKTQAANRVPEEQQRRNYGNNNVHNCKKGWYLIFLSFLFLTLYDYMPENNMNIYSLAPSSYSQQLAAILPTPITPSSIDILPIIPSQLYEKFENYSNDAKVIQKKEENDESTAKTKNDEYTGTTTTANNVTKSNIISEKITEPSIQERKSKVNWNSTAKNPYPVRKLTWEQTNDCEVIDGPSFQSVVDNGKWRVIISTNRNALYMGFVPSVVDHWRKLGVEPIVALIEPENLSEMGSMESEIQKYAEVVKFHSPKGITEGHCGKVARAYLASQLEDDTLVTIVDIDYYLLWFEKWKSHFKCVPANSILGTGYNRYSGTQQEGKWPMYLSTAKASQFRRFLNPENKPFGLWIKSFKGIRIFDKQEDPWQDYGKFSDESLFRALLSKVANEIDVTWVNTPSNWKRIDRSETRLVTKKEAKEAADVFANRPMMDCNTYTNRIKPIHKHLGILNITRDKEFFDAMKRRDISYTNWGGKNGKYITSLECIKRL